MTSTHAAPPMSAIAAAVANQRTLLGGLDHPHAHRRFPRIDELRVRQLRFQLRPRRAGHVIELDSYPAATRTQGPHRDEEVVPVPVGVGDAVREAAAPRSAVVEVGADNRVGVVADHETVVAAEAAVHVVREVVDVVYRREDTGVDRGLFHPGAQGRESPIHLRAREDRGRLLAVGQREQAGSFGNVRVRPSRRRVHCGPPNSHAGQRTPR